MPGLDREKHAAFWRAGAEEAWAPPPTPDLAGEVLEEARGLVAWLSSMS